MYPFYVDPLRWNKEDEFQGVETPTFRPGSKRTTKYRRPGKTDTDPEGLGTIIQTGRTTIHVIGNNLKQGTQVLGTTRRKKDVTKMRMNFKVNILIK